MNFLNLRSLICIIMLLANGSAFASNSGVTYQGRILKPNGSPLLSNNVQFRIQLRTPDAGNCLMYEEVQGANLQETSGSFSLTINDGSGSRLDNTGLTLDKIFANRGTFNLDPLLCSTGVGTYSPNQADGRNLVVLFKDATMANWEPIPAQKINFVPFAFEAKQIQGFTVSSLVRVTLPDGTPDFVTPLSNTAYTELLAIIGGTSAQWMKSNASNFSPSSAVNFNSQSLTNLATPSVGGDAVNKSYSDSFLGGRVLDTAVISALAPSEAGQLLTWDGAKWTATASQWARNGTSLSYSGGNVGIGISSPTKPLSIYSASDATALFSGDNAVNLILSRSQNSINDGGILFRKSRGTDAAKTVVNSGDATGTLSFQGYDGAAQRVSALIAGAVDGTPGGSDMPGRLMFFTTPDGAAAAQERMRIDNAGNIGIGTSAPKATLDINGFAKLKVNSSEPAACTALLAGSIAVTSSSTLCICKASGPAWVSAVDGTTACSW